MTKQEIRIDNFKSKRKSKQTQDQDQYNGLLRLFIFNIKHLVIIINHNTSLHLMKLDSNLEKQRYTSFPSIAGNTTMEN